MFHYLLFLHSLILHLSLQNKMRYKQYIQMKKSVIQTNTGCLMLFFNAYFPRDYLQKIIQ